MKQAIQWINRFIPSLPFVHTLTEDEILYLLKMAGILDFPYGAQMRPDEMEIILKRHPGLVVVISHMPYPHIDQAFRLLKEYKNVYLDGKNIFSDYRKPGGR